MTGFQYDVGIIGACGHVGLPLGLVFAKEGLKVLGIDINQESIALLNQRKMPFYEENSQEILEEVFGKTFFISDDDKKVAECASVIITIDTPLDKNFSVDLSKLNAVMTTLLPVLKKGQLVVLRSTLAPRTTDYVKNFIESKTSFRIGKDLFLATVPERLTQSNAVRELKELPNVLGVYDKESFEKAKKLFLMLNETVIQVTPLEAELAKLFTNSYRYANFALANEYFIIAETLGANIHQVRHAMNFKYPRCDLPKPGFAKGPCLGKDSWILLNAVPHFNVATTMISAAYRINDGLPGFVMQSLKNCTELSGKTVAFLGLAFKRDTDDTRDSLSVKLVNMLQNEFVHCITHDPYIDNKDMRQVLKDADVVIIATNHSFYEKVDFKGLVKKDALLVDLWNVLGKDQFMLRAGDL